MPKLQERQTLPDFARIARAVSDENRLRALLALRGRELCMCQLVDLLKLANSTVSEHMALLRTAGLVSSRKDGRWVHYRLAENFDSTTVRLALDWALGELGADPQILKDKEMLTTALTENSQETCA